MKIIKSIYRGYYKIEQDVKDAINVMAVVFRNWEFRYIEQATLQFIETDSKGFPPVPGQLIGIAKDLKAAELRRRQIEQNKLPEPNGIPMPEELKTKFNTWLEKTTI